MYLRACAPTALELNNLLSLSLCAKLYTAYTASRFTIYDYDIGYWKIWEVVIAPSLLQSPRALSMALSTSAKSEEALAHEILGAM